MGFNSGFKGLIRRACNSCFAFCRPRRECPPKHPLSRLRHCGFSVFSSGKWQGRIVATTSSHVSCNSLIPHHGRSLQASQGAGTVQALGYGQTFQTSNPFMDQKFASSPKRRGRLWEPPNFLLNGYRGSFPGVKRPGREVSHPSPPRSEMSETIPLLPRHASITSTRRL